VWLGVPIPKISPSREFVPAQVTARMYFLSTEETEFIMVKPRGGGISPEPFRRKNMKKETRKKRN
jgi:hypothetical protein